MMQDVYVKSNPELSWQKKHSPANWTSIYGETSDLPFWSIALYGTLTWILRKADQKYFESFEMWCWRRMEKISWIDGVRNEILITVKPKERPT